MEQEKIYWLFNAQPLSEKEHLITFKNSHFYLRLLSLAIEAGYTHLLADYIRIEVDDWKEELISIEEYKNILIKRYKKDYLKMQEDFVKNYKS